MSRIKYWAYLLNEEGQPIQGANVSIYEAGTENAVSIYIDESLPDIIDTSPQLTTNEDGYFEFWIGDTDETYGYSSTQKFKINWNKQGITHGYNDYISIIPSYLPVDITDTDTIKDKTVSNNLARLWENHRNDASYYVHGINAVDKEDDSITKNKLISNAIAKEWEETKWLKWIYVTDSIAAEPNRGYLIDAGENNVTIHLPEQPTVGMPVAMATINVNNTIMVNRNGKLIFGDANNLYLDLDTSGLTMVYTGESYGWMIVSEISGISPLDGDAIEISYVPDSYTRDATIIEAENELSLSAHLKGINDKLGSYSSTFNVYNDGWTEELGEFYVDIEHNINIDFPSVNIWDTDTRKITFDVEIESIDTNNIRLHSTTELNLSVIIRA